MKNCVICGEPLIRHEYKLKPKKYGKVYFALEMIKRFKNRKTCSRKCMHIFQRGQNNPNYKGIMPKCVDCQKRIGYKKALTPQLRCKECFKKFAEQTNYYQNTPQIKKLNLKSIHLKNEQNK